MFVKCVVQLLMKDFQAPRLRIELHLRHRCIQMAKMVMSVVHGICESLLNNLPKGGFY